jgi:uncharacterized protein with beta-barrel porin domain
MTKNRFLSKRLACLLTTALISSAIIPNNSLATTLDQNDDLDANTPTTATTIENQNFGADVTLTLNGIGDVAVGQISTLTAGQGTVVVNSFANFVGNVGKQGLVDEDPVVNRRIKAFTINEGKEAVLQQKIDSSAITINGLLILGDDDNGSANLATLTFGATGVTMLGRDIVTTQTAFITAATTGVVSNAAHKIHMPVTLTNAQTIKLFDNSAEPAAEVNAMLENNALFTYNAALDTGDTIVTATARTSSEVATQLGVNSNKANAFIQALAASRAAWVNDDIDSGLDSFETALFSGLSSDDEDTKFAKQVAPQTDTITGSTVAAKAVTSGVQNVISTRLASLRSGDAYSTGVVTGSGMSANSGFIQAFGSKVEQKNKGDESGYDADTTGFAIGFDTKVPGGAVVGISYARSEADVEGKGTGRAKNDIKTDSISLYADYATKDGYVEGSITYGKSDNKASRIINTAETNTTFRSNYDGEQYSFRLSGGIPQSLGGGAFFTPFAAATISQIKADAYTETSTVENDPLRLRVAQDTVDSQVGTIGIKYHQAIKDGKTTFTPEVKLALNNEFGDGNITTTNTYQGGGASFKNSTAIEKTSATAGVGLNISSDNVSFNIGYEADVREKYLGHSAQAKITAKF